MEKYKIFVKLPDKTLIFRVNEYETQKSGHYRFFDKITQTYRKYDSRICEIIEEVNK